MATTLRDLLIQRAARLQDRPALTAPGWGTLSYTQLRNRTEGVALGLLASPPPPALSSTTGTPWDWAAELAVAAAGLRWDPAAPSVPSGVLGGPRFNDEEGRGPHHAREASLSADTPFTAGLTHGDLLGRLRRLNRALGWDHDTREDLPLDRLGEPALRAALWSLLYAGGHAVLDPDPRVRWDPVPFAGFWNPDGGTDPDPGENAPAGC